MRPLGGSTTIDRRRVLRGALPGPSAKPLTSRRGCGSGGGIRGGWFVPGNHRASGASRSRSASSGASNGVGSKFVQTPWMSGCPSAVRGGVQESPDWARAGEAAGASASAAATASGPAKAGKRMGSCLQRP